MIEKKEKKKDRKEKGKIKISFFFFSPKISLNIFKLIFMIIFYPIKTCHVSPSVT